MAEEALSNALSRLNILRDDRKIVLKEEQEMAVNHLLNSVFYSIQEIETASPNAKITANSANSSQNKTLIHYKFIGTTCRRSRPIVRWSRG